MFQKLIGVFISLLLVSLINVSDGSSEYDSQIIDDNESIEFKQPQVSKSDYFIKNEGQWDSELHFIGDTLFGSVGFASNSVYFNLRGEETGHVLKYTFIDCKSIEPIGEDICTNYNNYFIGNNPEKWISNVPNYQRIRYEEVWEGIDIEYYFSLEGLKYDIILSPFSNPSDINIKIIGSEMISIVNGHIELVNDGKVLFREEPPLTYYSNTIGNIRSSYDLKDGHLRFNLEEYDKTKEVVIDPLLSSTLLGGNTDDHGRVITGDPFGNIFVVGISKSSNFPTTPGAYETTNSHDDADIVVFKMNSSLSDLLFSTYIGGSSSDFGEDIILDSFGNIIVTADSDSTDFPNPIGSYKSPDLSAFNTIILKLNKDGDFLHYSAIVGGYDQDHPYGLALDRFDNPYVVGTTSSEDDFPLLPKSYDKTFGTSGYSGFLVSLNNNGSSLNHSTFISGNSYDEAKDIEIDSHDNVVITGGTRSTDYYQTPGSFDISHNGYWDVFVTKFDHNITTVLNSTFLGGSGQDIAYGLSLDSEMNIYVTGETISSDFPTTSGAFDTTFNTQPDCFIVKMDPHLKRLNFSTFLGGSREEYGIDIEIDDFGYSYILSFVASSDFPTTLNTYQNTHNGGTYDLGLTKITPSGDSLKYSTFFGGDGYDRGYGLHLDENRRVYFTGYTETSYVTVPFPVTSGAYDTTTNGVAEITVSSFSMSYLSSKPRSLSGNLGDEYINLSWEPPISDGGADILNYKIYRNSNLGDGELIRIVSGREYFNDTTIANGGEYYYNITAVNFAGESPSSDVLTINDDEHPEIKRSYMASIAWTGDPFYFSYEFEDNVKVTENYIEYWYGDGEKETLFLTQNVSLRDVKTGFIIIPHDIENLLNYDIVLSDPSDNKVNIPRGRNISIFDNDPPEMILDRSDKVIYNGGFFNVSADFRDNIGIRLIRLVIDETCVVLGGNYYVYMDYVAGEKWIAPPFMISDNAIEISYHFEISDYRGNGKVTDPVVIEVFDDINPSFIEDNSDKYCYMGEIFDFKVDVDDNIGVESVRAIYQFANQSKQSVDLIQESSTIWETGINIPENPHAYGMYYHFEFEDLAGNLNSSHLNYIRIIDPILPTYQDLTTGKPTTGDFFRFHFIFEDNIRIDRLRVYYQIPEIEYKNNIGGNTNHNSSYELDELVFIPKEAYGNLIYWVEVGDYNTEIDENVVISPKTRIEIIDNDAPIIFQEYITGELNSGETIEFSFSIFENVGLEEMKIEYGFRSRTYTIDLTDPYRYIGEYGFAGLYRYDITIPKNTNSPLKIKLYSKDTSRLTTNWGPVEYPVNDTILPEIIPIEDQSIEKGNILDITPIVSDNINVYKIEWEGAPIIPIEGKLLGVVDEPGVYEITVTVYDEAGNSNSTSFTLTVTLKEEGSRSLLAISLIIGIIVVIIVIGVIVGFLFLKKRKETEKEAEEILDDKKTIIPAGPKDERYLPTQRKLPPAQPQSLKPKPVVFTPPAPSASSIYKTAEEMPRAPTPLRGDDYISPDQKHGDKVTKTQVKGELGPKHTNLLNPKR